MIILGLSAFYHDSAAAIIINGKIIAASQEERFTRIKHDPSFPLQSINYVLNEAKVTIGEVNNIVFYDKPLLKFERLLETHISMAPFGFKSFSMAMPIWLKEKLFLKDFLYKQFKLLNSNFDIKTLKFCEHHLSHASSAFFPSPFEKSIVLTIDGVGEWATTSVAIGNKNSLEIVKEIHFPHSIGLLYSAFTYYCGFKVNSGEYKLMGLAPYGEAKYLDIILNNIIDIKDDGSFQLNLKYFNFPVGLTMTNQEFASLFGQPVRMTEKEDLTQFHMDIAASIQAVTEKIIMNMTNSLCDEYKIHNLCLAGGVALNCVANGKVLRNNKYNNIWIQPASGDAGGSIGAALAYWHVELKKRRIIHSEDAMNGSYLGPSYTDKDVEKDLKNNKAIFKKFSYDEMIVFTAKALSENKAVGWFQGRMEFGPRALGNRSILGNPLSEKTQKILNLKIKYRESFRPFAPSILLEHVDKWFDLKSASPYMLMVANIKDKLKIPVKSSHKKLFGIKKLNIKRSKIPAVTHVDYSARIQTVDKKTNKTFHDLIKQFYNLTNCPILVNTSFNVRNEPIVCNPKDALRCFMGSEMDVLVINNFVLEKNKQKDNFFKDYHKNFKLD